MEQKPDIPICILAGGTSRRFGSDKALAVLDGKPLLSHVLERLSDQTSGLIAINTGNVAKEKTFNKKYMSLNNSLPSNDATKGFDITYDVLARLASSEKGLNELNKIFLIKGM